MATPLALRAVEHYVVTYRRTWRGTIVTAIVTPVLFLAAMGLGLGSLVDDQGGPGGVPYLVFIAPGLLAAGAMQSAVLESSWPVLGALKWQRLYYAQTATPLRPVDVCLGQLLWVAVRVLQGAAVFWLVALAFGAVERWGSVLAVPMAVLVGTAFSAPVAAFAVARQSEQGLSALFRFGITPMFLFSGTFFPVSQLPAALRPVAWLTPLWHGVSLCRGLWLGTMGVAAGVGHLAFLVTVTVLGGAAAVHWYTARLTP